MRFLQTRLRTSALAALSRILATCTCATVVLDSTRRRHVPHVGIRFGNRNVSAAGLRTPDEMKSMVGFAKVVARP